MNIYFACSITGGRAFEAVYQDLTAALLADGHEVPTAHLADSGVVKLEAVVSYADKTHPMMWQQLRNAMPNRLLRILLC